MSSVADVIYRANVAKGKDVEYLDFQHSVNLLFDLLQQRKMNYVLVGGIALLHYVPGRNTEDIDLVIGLKDLKLLPKLEIKEQNPYFALAYLDGLRVDLLLTQNKLFKRVLEKYSSLQTVFGREIRCATVEGLILLKLYALPNLYRQGDFARVGIYENDVATLIQAYKPNLEPLLIELGKYLEAAELEEVGRIVAELNARIARFERGREK